MGRGRLEAFSDGVMAIIITIMVLEIKVPHGGTLNDLRPLLPVFLSYILSFVYVGIYWNNHHHMLHASTRVTRAMLWCRVSEMLQGVSPIRRTRSAIRGSEPILSIHGSTCIFVNIQSLFS